jgi:hypothetical protein
LDTHNTIQGADDMTLIESIDYWDALSAELQASGYTLYQMQYSIQHPEGFHARFWLSGRPLVEIVTHNYDVYMAIRKFPS